MQAADCLRSKAFLLRTQAVSTGGEIIEAICAVAVCRNSLLLSVAVTYRHGGSDHDSAKLIGNLTAQRGRALCDYGERAKQNKGCESYSHIGNSNSHLLLLLVLSGPCSR